MEVTYRAFALAALAACGTSAAAPSVATTAPHSLLETGFASLERRPFTPQYPLWSDGATKQRWIYLPSHIDAGAADWSFPVGTKLWKQFAYSGALAETRYMEHTAGGWIYATYDASGSLVDARGTKTLPSQADCRACHENGATPVLGFSALQLSTDRDPNAPHAEQPIAGSIDLRTLLVEGMLANVPYALVVPPRIPGSPTERAAIGYLHGNCSGCHREGGAAGNLGMFLDADHARSTTIGRKSSFAPAGKTMRIVAGRPDESVLFARASSRDAATQMPPLGTRVVDDDAIALLRHWITNL